MLRENSIVTVGIYRSGAHVRLLGELDLITQENGHKDNAIFLFETTFLKNPNEDITDTEIESYKRSVKSTFRDNRFSFKADSREAADLFISQNTANWSEILKTTV